VAEITYGKLDRVLRSLGFAVRVTAENGRLYHHAETGALIGVPGLPFEDAVLPRHLVAARMQLEAFGITDPTDFDAKMQKAS
jgi:hypothetical protein